MMQTPSQQRMVSLILLGATLLFSNNTPTVSALCPPGRQDFLAGRQQQQQQARLTQSSATSALFYRDGNEDVEEIALRSTPSTSSVPTTGQLSADGGMAQAINPIDLPRHSPPKEVVKQQALMYFIEMAMGRVAMVAAVCLLIGEVTTGRSISEQLLSLL